MNNRQAGILPAVFATPVSPSVAWADVETLLVAVGCRVIEGDGSRVGFEKGGIVASFHRPHPDKPAKRYQIRTHATIRSNRESGHERERGDDLQGIPGARGVRRRREIFAGHLGGIDDVVGFHAETASGLKAAFQDAVDDYVSSCERAGKAPDKPCSGTITFHVAPDVHAKATRAARLSGKSLDQWGEDVLRTAARAITAE